MSQPYYFRHYEVENGLSNNAVITALQDKYGFVWLGTSDGLSRFDGNSFKVYKHLAGDPYSLKSNSVYCLYEDSKGSLWVGTEKGISLYDPAHDAFRQPVPVDNGTVRSICDDADGRLWFILKDALYYYDPQKRRTVKKYIPGITYVSVVYKDAKEGIWIGSVDGKIVYLQGNQATVYNVSARPQNSVEAIHAFKDNQLLIGTSKEGLLEFDRSQKTIKHLINGKEKAANIFVRNILQVSDSSFFISTENGLYIYNPVNSSYRHLLKTSLNPFSLSDNALYALCKDSEGGIWIGSYFGGVNYLPHSPLIFEKHIPTSDPNSLSGNAVREITKDRYGNIWIGSEDGGLTLLDPAKNAFKKYKPDRLNRLSSSNIHGLLAIGHQLLIGTFERGLDIMDIPEKKVVRHFNAGSGPYDLKSNFINKIFQSSGGEIWICTAHGVFRFDIKQGRFYRQQALPANVFYSAIAEDSTGTLWIGSHNKGVFYFNKNHTGSLILPTDKKNILRNTRILYLMPDTNNQLWVCTIDGLFCINLNNKNYKYYNSEQGLPSDIVYAIVKDNLGNYWIPTSQGLAWLDKQTHQIRVFRQNNGLLNNQFNYQSVYKNENGDIYSGSIKGLIKFNPAFFHTTEYIPPLYITKLQLPRTNSAPQAGFTNDIPLLTKKQIELTYDQATFNIEFAALEFTDPLNILYTYKINNSNWYQVGNTRKITFANLSPGTYDITIRSTNGAGTWMPNEKTITIKILPPLWKSPAAYLLYAAVIIAIVLISFRYYVKRQKEKQRYKMDIFALNKEKELYQAKMEFFTNITHEIKTPLTLIKVPLETISKSANEIPQFQKHLQIMNSNAERLFELTNQLLDFRKTETEHYQLYFSETDLNQIITDTWGRFTPAMEQKKIKHSLITVAHPVIVWGDKDALTKILSNLVDNAIKYCDAQVIFKIEVPGQQDVKIIVMNDGPVVPLESRSKMFDPFIRLNIKNTSGSGIGLSLARSLTELHKGMLIYSTTNNFNTFELTLPYITICETKN
ncbi:ligand-binding sensor domain-containing protein [Niabella aquatica]